MKSSRFNLTPDEKAKAPKWLLRKYEDLQRERDRLEDALDTVNCKNNPVRVASGIALYPSGLLDAADEIHLRDSAIIRFRIDGARGDYIDVARPFNFSHNRYDRRGIELRAADSLVQAPGASNTQVISTRSGMPSLLNERR